MTRKEFLYQTLETNDAKPSKNIKGCNVKDLETAYSELAEDIRIEADKEWEQEKSKKAEIKIESLEFATSGWCNELKTSYSRGKYLPLSIEEYKALKPYSLKG